MTLFAARNELVTIILALIPVAVFILSNLYKAFSKVTPPPGGVNPKPGPPPVPRTMDLEAFLREAKKQTQGPAVPVPPPNRNRNQAPSPSSIQKGSTPFQDRKKPLTIPKTPTQIKPRGNPIPRPKGADPATKITPKIPEYSHRKLATNLEVMTINLGEMDRKKTPKDNPVVMALDLLKKPHAGAELIVLREILGPPRSRNPFRPF